MAHGNNVFVQIYLKDFITYWISCKFEKQTKTSEICIETSIN
jgi:hypothetical protein